MSHGNQPKINHMNKSKLSISLLVLAVVMVTGATFANETPPSVPDAGSTSLLLSMAFAGMAVVRKFMR